MKIFWKVNRSISLSIFLGYLLLLLNMVLFKIDFYCLDFIEVLFFYAPFFEIIQIPLCLLVALLWPKKQEKGLYKKFVIMLTLFLFKMITYLYVLTGGVSLINCNL